MPMPWNQMIELTGGKPVDGNRRVEEKLGVEFQHVALVYHRSAIDLECDIECLEDANIQKRIRRRAVGVVRAEFDPQGQHERLASVERHVNMTGRAVARSVREGHEHDMRGNDGIAVSINWNGEYTEEPSAHKSHSTPARVFPKCMRVSGHFSANTCVARQRPNSVAVRLSLISFVIRVFMISFL